MNVNQANKKILKELKKILKQEKSKDENSISIYDVLQLARGKKKEFLDLRDSLCLAIKTKCECSYAEVDFMYQDKLLYIFTSRDGVIFLKEYDGDLIVDSGRCFPRSTLVNLKKCEKEISECYDIFSKDIGFFDYHMDDVKSTNSNFIINNLLSINVIRGASYALSISEKIKSEGFFELAASLYKDEYEYKHNSDELINICRGNEKEILKKIFVKISDCPEWMHEILYKIRKEQLKEQEEIEFKREQEEIEYKRMKKQRRLELVRKLNPFCKK